ncbi:MAG TPA: hypothetical protein VJL90_14700, partial [Pseudorhodoplanes sp.]|nr:hypothetical protein [Pseudorhodoplanes sp.]
MSIESEDIDAAIAAGVMPQAQADALRAFVAERHRSRLEQAGTEDERFRFMTGFNDFFFAIGILLLGFGMMFFTGARPWPSAIAALIVWGLSELLVRRMRLVLPGILLSIFFVIFVYGSVPVYLEIFSSPQVAHDSPIRWFMVNGFGLTGPVIAVVAKTLIGTAAAALYYWRFRLPFALLPIAASLVLVAISLITLVTGPISPMTQSLLTLVCGLAVFAVAMTFDLSDRDRMTRRSDCAFWLHLLAAPLIVHSLISLITPRFDQINNTTALAILLVIAALAIVAIAIDRRALLVSALLYIGLVIGYA